MTKYLYATVEGNKIFIARPARRPALPFFSCTDSPLRPTCFAI